MLRLTTFAQSLQHLLKLDLCKIRVLLDSGSSGSIILAKFVNKLHLNNDVKTQWLTKGGIFNTTKQCKTNFILHDLYENRLIEWNLYVDFISLPQCYDLIIGHDFYRVSLE
jgi:hypothetical protein